MVFIRKDVHVIVMETGEQGALGPMGPAEPEPNEVAEVRPTLNPSTKCYTCHKELVIRRPTPEEQISVLQFLREKWDLNVSKPEDIYLIGEPCSCGQDKQAFFEIGADKMK